MKRHPIDPDGIGLRTPCDSFRSASPARSAAGRGRVVDQVFEPLERRVLLAGDDHPDREDFPHATLMEMTYWVHNVYRSIEYGIIETPDDTDLFRFTVPQDSRNAIFWAWGSEGGLQPAIEILDISGQTVMSHEGIRGVAFLDPTGANGGLVRVEPGTECWVLVRAGATNSYSPMNTGHYAVFVFTDRESEGGSGPHAAPPPATLPATTSVTPAPPGQLPSPPARPDDAANAGEFDRAAAVALDATGAGRFDGLLELMDDTDLFRFTAPAAGPVYITLTTPITRVLRASVQVFDADHNPVSVRAVALAGTTAALSFDGTAGGEYYALVSSANEASGFYTLQVAARPLSHVLYYPEGFSSANIAEFVALVNPNDAPARYTVTVRYEWGERDQEIASGTLGAFSRGGLTISTRGRPELSLVRRGVPYAIEVRSDLPLGASLSHYDFGATTGESFTTTTSEVWTFAEAHRAPAQYRDFLVFQNPHDEDVSVSITLIYDDGITQTFEHSIGALRRGGISFQTNPNVWRAGRFAVRVEATRPIVAALTSFDIARGGGTGRLGLAGDGSRAGSLPTLDTGDELRLSAINMGTETALVTFRISYLDRNQPDSFASLDLEPGRPARLTAANLGVEPGRRIAVRYRADHPVALSGVERRHGDADDLTVLTDASTTAFFGDAYVNPRAAGKYLETLDLYNPTAGVTAVTVTFLFVDGATATRDLQIEGDGFASLRLQDEPAILARGRGTPFSVRVDADQPVAASLRHYDLFLNGGWGARGVDAAFAVPMWLMP